MKKWWLLFVFIMVCQLIPAQEMSPIFSSGNEAVDHLTNKARQEMLKNDNNLPAMKIADQAKQAALTANEPLAIAKANATLAWIFLDGNNFEAAQNFVQKALKNIEGKNFPEADAMLHHQLAIIQDKMGKPKPALANYLKSIKFYQDSNNFLKQTQIFTEIARLYLVTGDQESFNIYFKKAHDLLKQHPNAHMQLAYNNQLSYVLMGQGKFEDAYRLNKKSIDLALKYGKKDFVGTAYYNAAGALFEQGKSDEAMRLIDEGMAYAKKNDMAFGDFLLGKAQILSAGGKNADAEQLYLTSLSELVKSKNKFMEMQARRLLADYYAENNQKERSLEQTLAARQIEDSIASVKQSIALKEVEYQYKDEEKEKLLESYKTSVKLKNWIIGLVFLLALAALYFFINTRKNLKLRQTLFEKKEKLLETEKAKALQDKELALSKEEKAMLNEKLLKEEQQRLKLEKENTDRELASITLYVQEKNKMMEELQAKIDGLLSHSSEANRAKILDITRNIRQSINFEKDWDKIKLHFEKVHPEFFAKLSETCPQLTQNELKHCAYIKMNMSNKETANLLGVDHNTVKMSRYRIKKKMELPQEADLTQVINNI